MYNEMMDTIGLVNTVDPELAAAMDRELNRQRQNIELIASENIVSPAVMAAMGSILTNKYAEGLPGKRYYGGCVYVDEVENIAIERACKLFGAKYANVQPTPVHRPIWQFICSAGSGAILSWAWTCLRAPSDPRFSGKHVRQEL